MSPNKSFQSTKKRELINSLTNDVRKLVRESISELDDEEISSFIDKKILEDYATNLDINEKIDIANIVFARTRKELSILQPIADNPDVTEIMVNGKDCIFIEKNGRLMITDVSFDSTEELEDVIRKIAGKVHREINEHSPILDARLMDGSRVNAVYKNIALGGPAMTIRRFPKTAISMEDLIRYESLPKHAADFLIRLVRAGYNIFISGGTNSGKTTFLNALSNFIPEDERVVTIEDSAELQITGVQNIVKLECREANAQGKGSINMKQLIKSSLRMRPNRIIVGEVRGEEVLDMIQAMNTGHSGSLSTGHGNSPQGMLYRLEAMFLQAADFPIEAIRRQIAEGIDIMVHLGRLANKKRKVLEISEVNGVSEGTIRLNKIFSYEHEKGLVKVGKLINIDKILMMGESTDGI